ncbi:unnamed protein product [Gongylonema pulchrum]|uniref:DUF1716 domain-containing protein n=1 Tax=Gongylonema pulchrum TaxID=637853 RepID=A0A183D9G5_9BILA|nr:unnamed protein product [Gongylonema pulchrum]
MPLPALKSLLKFYSTAGKRKRRKTLENLEKARNGLLSLDPLVREENRIIPPLDLKAHTLREELELPERDDFQEEFGAHLPSAPAEMETLFDLFNAIPPEESAPGEQASAARNGSPVGPEGQTITAAPEVTGENVIGGENIAGAENVAGAQNVVAEENVPDENAAVCKLLRESFVFLITILCKKNNFSDLYNVIQYFPGR